MEYDQLKRQQMNEFNDLPDQEKQRQLNRIKEIMIQYNRQDGYIRLDGKVLNFYDGPVDEGAYIKINDL